MKLIHFLLILIVTVIFFFYCQPSGVTTDDNPYKPPEDDDLYFITQNGDPNALTTNEIDTEYDSFLFLNNSQGRNIFVGGQVNSLDFATHVYVWLYSEEINEIDPYIQQGYPFQLYARDYNLDNEFDFAVPLYKGFNKDADNYAVKVQIGAETYNTDKEKYEYNPESSKDLTFIITDDLNAKDFHCDVYQQQSYNEFNDVSNEINYQFYDIMRINTIGNFNIINSSLTDEIVDYNEDWYTLGWYDKCTLVQYAYTIIDNSWDPGNTPHNIQIMYNFAKQYWITDGMCHGLLFYVQDYNLISGYLSSDLYGTTIADMAVNEPDPNLYRVPSLCFVFVQRIKDDFDNAWEDKMIKATAIHELGHLWCDGITNTDHTFWHNGKDKKKCVISRVPLQTSNPQFPTTTGQAILNKRGFCEGHQKRCMNVSWKLQQYEPFDVVSESKKNNNIYASTNNQYEIYENSDNIKGKIEIKLEIDSSSFIQGKLFPIYLTLSNNGDKSINLSTSDIIFNVNDHTRNKNLNIKPKTWANHYINIDANNKTVFPILLTGIISYKDEGSIPSIPWYYWKEGKYSLSLSIDDGYTIDSNLLSFSIEKIPDSLTTAFEDLKYYLDSKKTKSDYENNINKYKDSFYEHEFIVQLLDNFNYMENASKNVPSFSIEMTNTMLEKLFIKYPNTAHAYDYFKKLYIQRDKNIEFYTYIINKLKVLSKTKWSNSNRLISLIKNNNNIFKDLAIF